MFLSIYIYVYIYIFMYMCVYMYVSEIVSGGQVPDKLVRDPTWMARLPQPNALRTWHGF